MTFDSFHVTLAFDAGTVVVADVLTVEPENADLADFLRQAEAFTDDSSIGDR